MACPAQVHVLVLGNGAFHQWTSVEA